MPHQPREYPRATGMIIGGNIGAASGAVAGGVLGYKAGNDFSFWALQRKYNVPAPVVQASIVYGLLLSKNRSLLMAAYKREKTELTKLLSHKMELIFGTHWREKIEQFLNEYKASPIIFETIFRNSRNKKLEGTLRIFSAVFALNSGNFLHMPVNLKDQMEAMKSVYQTLV